MIRKEEQMMDIQKTIKSLEARGYIVHFFETEAEAADYLVENIRNTTVGTGGSMTLDALDILDRLEETNTVYYRNRSKNPEDARKAMFAPVYITSANGVSENGEIVNIDGAGNRVAAASYDKERLYYVIGVNKICPDLESAIERARTIAAPLNAQRLNRNTPCNGRPGKCYDCSAADRLCRNISITLGKMLTIGSVEVIIINRELGY
ncbi:MAG: lactate utilization protein [Candidatus Heteroscillospira sp.]|jgi:L-lactate utilization protein LutB